VSPEDFCQATRKYDGLGRPLMEAVTATSCSFDETESALTELIFIENAAKEFLAERKRRTEAQHTTPTHFIFILFEVLKLY